MEPFKDGREFLKAHSWERHRAFESDQRKGVRMPPVQKQAGEGDTLVSLVDPEMLSVKYTSPADHQAEAEQEVITDESLSLELSYLLGPLRDSGIRMSKAAPRFERFHLLERGIRSRRIYRFTGLMACSRVCTDTCHWTTSCACSAWTISCRRKWRMRATGRLS